MTNWRVWVVVAKEFGGKAIVYWSSKALFGNLKSHANPSCMLPYWLVSLRKMVVLMSFVMIRQWLASDSFYTAELPGIEFDEQQQKILHQQLDQDFSPLCSFLYLSSSSKVKLFRCWVLKAKSLSLSLSLSDDGGEGNYYYYDVCVCDIQMLFFIFKFCNSLFFEIISFLNSVPHHHHRHRAEWGKLLVREKISTLLDAGSPFLELSLNSLVWSSFLFFSFQERIRSIWFSISFFYHLLSGRAHDLYGEDVPTGGVIINWDWSYNRIEKIWIVANDATVWKQVHWTMFFHKISSLFLIIISFILSPRNLLIQLLLKNM